LRLLLQHLVQADRRRIAWRHSEPLPKHNAMQSPREAVARPRIDGGRSLLGKDTDREREDMVKDGIYHHCQNAGGDQRILWVHLVALKRGESPSRQGADARAHRTGAPRITPKIKIRDLRWEARSRQERLTLHRSYRTTPAPERSIVAYSGCMITVTGSPASNRQFFERVGQ
jgi:hypothetical protein